MYHKFPNFTVKFNDTMAYIVPSRSYLVKTFDKFDEEHCLSFIFKSELDDGMVVLGDSFAENYLV